MPSTPAPLSRITSAEAAIRKLLGATTRVQTSLRPGGLREEYLHMVQAARDHVVAAGPQPGAALAAVRGLADRHSKFLASLPTRMPPDLLSALKANANGYRTALSELATAIPTVRPGIKPRSRAKPKPKPGPKAPSSGARDLARRITLRPKRKVLPGQLKNNKPQLSLKPRARIPDRAGLRLIAGRIARRHPRPARMTEATYSDFILEMTKRAAVRSANAQADGATSEVALQIGADATGADAAAVMEEVTAGVTAPAGEEVVAAAVQDAADDVLQGAAEAGGLPSVDASSPVLTDTPSASAVPEFVPSTTENTVQSPAEVPDTTVNLEVYQEAPPVPEPVPFYRRPVFLAGGLLGMLAIAYGLSQHQQPAGE